MQKIQWYYRKAQAVVRDEGLTSLWNKAKRFFSIKVLRADPHLSKPTKRTAFTPWIVPFEEKLNTLSQGFSAGKKNVVYLYESPDSSTFRYRVYNMCQVLRQSKTWCGTYFFADELDKITPYLDRIDVIVVVRFRWSFSLEQLVNEAKKQKIKLIFDVDDLVYNVKYISLITAALNVNVQNHRVFAFPNDMDFWFSYCSRLNLSGSYCDAIISTNGFLTSRLENDFGKKAYIIPNFLNQEQEEVSKKLFDKKSVCEKGHAPSSRQFYIGYFSGSRSHGNDFKTIALELKALLEKYRDIVLVVVGYMELPECLVPLYKKKRIIRKPMQNFIALQERIAEVDVNIIPLVDNEFTNCKSELKYFEASIVGTVTCATPTYVYQKIIEHGKNGFLCQPGEWYATIEQIYKKTISRSDVAKNAMMLSTEKYGSLQQLPMIESVFNSLLT